MNKRRGILSIGLTAIFIAVFSFINLGKVLAWHALTECKDKVNWVLTGPVEDWSVNTTFTFDFDKGPTQSAVAGVPVTASADAATVHVTYSDSEEFADYDRPKDCTPPPVVYQDSASAKSFCDDGNKAVLSVTVTLGGPADNVVVYNGQEHELGAKPAGTFTVTYPASAGSVPVIVTVVRDEVGKDVLDTTIKVETCTVVTTTTQPAPTTTQPAPTTTQPAPTTTQPAPTTTQPAPTTTQPAPTTTPAPTTVAPTTTLKVTTSTLPATGSGTTSRGSLIAIIVLFFGLIAVIIARRPRLS